MSSETIEVVRDGRVVIGATDLIYSPDDGGYYFSQVEFSRNRRRVSDGIFRSDRAAKDAWRRKAVEWEPWR